MKWTGIFKLDQEKLTNLQCQAQTGTINAEGCQIVLDMVRLLLTLINALSTSRITIRQLQSMLFGPKTEKGPKSENKTSGSEEKKQKSSTEKEAESKESPEKEETEKKKRKGHGRRAADTFKEAKTVKLPLSELSEKQSCPECAEGTLYRQKPKITITFSGSPIVTPTRYEMEQLRCNLCGTLFRSQEAETIVRTGRYAPSAKTAITLQKYWLGSSFSSMERYQKMMKVPLSDATCWDLVAEVAAAGFPIFHYLKTLAAQADLVHTDDTTIKILSMIKENKESSDKKSRKGMYTTCVNAFKEGREIVLFLSGRKHSGENFRGLHNQREPGSGVMLKMSDALKVNREFIEGVINCYCLVHSRRKFFEIKEFFPEECGHVIKEIGEIYTIEALCKKRRLSDEERLALHRKKSRPRMVKLGCWLRKKLRKKEIEPNSRLGDAARYMMKHWIGLTQFYRVRGAPLDNNAAERSLKIPIRNRKTAGFYKTELGALIGDILMSLILTTERCGENPMEYLNALQEYRTEARMEPDRWLPWNWRETIASL